jgi:hypothetical protein
VSISGTKARLSRAAWTDDARARLAAVPPGPIAPVFTGPLGDIEKCERFLPIDAADVRAMIRSADVWELGYKICAWKSGPARLHHEFPKIPRACWWRTREQTWACEAAIIEARWDKNARALVPAYKKLLQQYGTPWTDDEHP